MGNFAGVIVKITKISQQQSKFIAQTNRVLQMPQNPTIVSAKVALKNLLENQIAILLALSGLE